MLRLPAAIVLAVIAHAVSAIPHPHGDHEHAVERSLPNAWYHPVDHPTRALFRRDDAPTVGSPAWAASFPASTPNPSQLPSAWTSALSAAVSAGKIPNIPPTTFNNWPDYPTGFDGTSQEVCSAFYKCRVEGDIWDAPDGVFGIGFDDGPVLGPSGTLYSFLQDQNTSATHFMIGVAIMSDQADFATAFNLGHDIAVHTWTHPYMTTLSNVDVLGQLGYTMQIIHDLTDGRIPRYWRPPYGDADNRVRAIAKEIFGLETIIWNQDTEDWSIPTNGTTIDAVDAKLTGWFGGPKSPGLIILEHELSAQSVQSFINAFPLVASNGWITTPVTQLVPGTNPYQNAASDAGPVSPGNIISPAFAAGASSSSASSSSSTSAPVSTASSSSTPKTTTASASPSTSTKAKSGAVTMSVPSALYVIIALGAALFI